MSPIKISAYIITYVKSIWNWNNFTSVNGTFSRVTHIILILSDMAQNFIGEIAAHKTRFAYMKWKVHT